MTTLSNLAATLLIFSSAPASASETPSPAEGSTDDDIDDLLGFEEALQSSPEAEPEPEPELEPEPEPESGASPAMAPGMSPAAQRAERRRARRKPLAGGAGKKVRIHGATELMGFTHVNPDGNNDNTNGGGLGLGRTSLADGALNGGGQLHFRPLWSIGAGFLFFDDRVVAGAKLGFAVDAWRADDSGEEGVKDDPRELRSSGLFVAYLRWLFRPGYRARPYAGLHLGVGGGLAGARGETTEARSRVNTVWPEVGLDGGVHLFIVDAVSVDFGLAFDYFALHNRTIFSDDDGDTTTDDWEKTADIVNLGGQLGISAWF